MSSPTIKNIVDTLKTLTLLEVSELITEIEETFDVDASASMGGGFMMPPTGTMPAATNVASDTEKEDDEADSKRKSKKEEKETEKEPDTFNVILKKIDEKKRLDCYKVIRLVKKDLTIPKVKEFLENLPQVLAEKQKEEEVKIIEEKLKATNAEFETVLA